jgi:hypothetical protein
MPAVNGYIRTIPDKKKAENPEIAGIFGLVRTASD